MSAFSRARAKVRKYDRAAKPKVTRPIDQLRADLRTHRDAALDEAHKLVTKHLHCPTLFGNKKHGAIEYDVAKALVAAFYRGRGGRRG